MYGMGMGWVSSSSSSSFFYFFFTSFITYFFLLLLLLLLNYKFNAYKLTHLSNPPPPPPPLYSFTVLSFTLVCCVAGGLSVLAVGCSWLRPAHIFQPPDGAPLMEDCGLEGLDTLTGPGNSPCYPYLMDREPPPPLEGNPPPPYSP